MDRLVLDVLRPVNPEGSYQGETKCIPTTSVLQATISWTGRYGMCPLYVAISLTSELQSPRIIKIFVCEVRGFLNFRTLGRFVLSDFTGVVSTTFGRVGSYCFYPGHDVTLDLVLFAHAHCFDRLQKCR